MAFTPNSIAVGRDTARERRERTLLPCRLIYGPRGYTAEGFVRNRSESGALLRISSTVELVVPKSVQVAIGRDGDGYEALVVWRKGNELGLKFTSHFNLKTQADESTKNLRRIWAEMALRPGADTLPSPVRRRAYDES
jgi:hypothetical protein